MRNWLKADINQFLSDSFRRNWRYLSLAAF